MRTGIPPLILAERLDMLLTLAKLKADADQPVGQTLNEAQDVLQQLKGAI
jgi:hypothetical protein